MRMPARKAVETPNGNSARESSPSIIIVEVLGYGGGSDDGGNGNPPPREPAAPDTGQRSQNPNSAVQVVGAGPLSPREQLLLTEEERRKLQ